MCYPYYLLLLVFQYRVTILTRAYRIGVDDIAYKDATISYLTRMSHLQNHLDGRIKNNISTHDGDSYTLDDIRRILNATVYTFLTALPDTMHIMVLKPVDIRRKQGLLDLIKLGLANNKLLNHK